VNACRRFATDLRSATPDDSAAHAPKGRVPPQIFLKFDEFSGSVAALGTGRKRSMLRKHKDHL